VPQQRALIPVRRSRREWVDLVLTISKLKRWSINYYIDTARAAETASHSTPACPAETLAAACRVSQFGNNIRESENVRNETSAPRVPAALMPAAGSEARRAEHRPLTLARPIADRTGRCGQNHLDAHPARRGASPL